MKTKHDMNFEMVDKITLDKYDGRLEFIINENKGIFNEK